MKDDRFATGRLQRDNGTAADFAPSASRCGDGDEWGRSRPVGFLIKPDEIQTGSFQQQARRFADVQRAATAKSNDAITVVLAELGGSFADVLLDWIWVDPLIDEPLFTLRRFAQSSDNAA